MKEVMRKKRTGFTIVELLIVIVVIAILAAISIVAYNGIQERARDSQRYSDFSLMQKALKMYYADNGVYPKCGTATGTRGGCIWSDVASKLSPKYISTVPRDPINISPNNMYYYAWGYEATGPMTHGATDSDQDYSIGTYIESKKCPCSSHWAAQINHVVGT
jgi:prepilin-type N-terminal cleavage/methylation domain-containing protein